MKTLILQIFGLVLNLFLVFIIISYSNLDKFQSSLNFNKMALNEAGLTDGKMRNSLALNKISILLI